MFSRTRACADREISRPRSTLCPAMHYAAIGALNATEAETRRLPPRRPVRFSIVRVETVAVHREVAAMS